MNRRSLLIVSLLAIVALLAVACSGMSAAPAPTSTPTVQQPAAQNNVQPPASDETGSSATTFKTQTVDGGSVTVAVTPVVLKAGALLEFDIAMNTHSVDLSNDMLTAVVLQDDTGKEYAPTAWDGPAEGGHHREGKIKFGALVPNAKSVTLIVKGIAGVPERTFKWSL